MISSSKEYSRFKGLSTDTKPTGNNGDTFFEMDTNKTYMYDRENGEWVEVNLGGGSGGGGGDSKSSPIVGTGVVGSMVVGSEGGGSGSNELYFIGITDDIDITTMDKTWKEIYDASVDGKYPIGIRKVQNAGGSGFFEVEFITIRTVYYDSSSSNYLVWTDDNEYVTNSENGYPSHSAEV